MRLTLGCCAITASSSEQYFLKAKRPEEDARSFVPTWIITVCAVSGMKSSKLWTSSMRAPHNETNAGVPGTTGSKCWCKYLVCESPNTIVETWHLGNIHDILFTVGRPESRVRDIGGAFVAGSGNNRRIKGVWLTSEKIFYLTFRPWARPSSEWNKTQQW